MKPGELAQAINDSPDTHISVYDHTQVARIDTLHLTTLQEFGHRLLRLEDANERLRTLCRLMIRNDFHGLGAVAVRISKENPQLPAQVLIEPSAHPRLKQWRPYISRGLLKAVRQTDSPAMASTAPRSAEAIEISIAPEAQQGPSHAAIVCPIRSDERKLDILYATFPPEYATPEWMALVALACQQYQHAEAEIFAAQKAKAHQSLEQELARARDIQMKLLPAKLNVEGLDIALGFDPCRFVGGDYADAIMLKDGRVLLVVADVCGKGLSAALISSGLHTMLHTLMRAEVNLTDAITSVNQYLCQFTDDRSFVTLVAVVVDPRTGKLEIANAGHMAPLIVSTTGSSRTLEDAPNMPLGVDPHEQILIQSAALEHGELIALYTDGLTELRDDTGQMLGTARLCQELASIYRTHSAKTCADLSTSLRNYLNRIQGDRVPLDDRTYVLAKRR
jgi:serine phosphatase RsbU (regulator of sigma subunit)